MDVIIENKEFDYLSKANQIVKVFENKFDENVEFAIQGFYKIYSGIKRTEWATVYQLSQNRVLKDAEQYGDRTLSLFIKENQLNFCTYDLDTQNKNLCKSITFEDYEEGKWALIHNSYSRIQQKVYSFVQFQGNQGHDVYFDNVKHQPSSYYVFQGAQSFSYKNFPGKIIGQTFFSGAGNFRECGFDQIWKQLVIVERIYVFEVIIIYEIDFEVEENEGVVQIFENKFEKTLEFAIFGWFQINKKISRKNWSTGYHLNSNKIIQDQAEFGDRTLAFFIKDYNLQFCSYDINSGDKNVNENLTFQQENEDIWIFIYQAYSPTLQKMFVYVQFNKQKENILQRIGLKHQYSHIYTLFVGQSFTYKKWPGQIRSLSLCAGVGCYKEKGFELAWNYFETVYTIHIYNIIEDEEDFEDEDEEKPKEPIVKFFEQEFSGIQEFGIEGWFKISPGSNRNDWATGYHLNTNENVQDLAEHGDRTLSFFVKENSLHFQTYDIASDNKNLQKKIDFSYKEEGTWCYIYQGYSPVLQKAYVFTQFQGQKSNVLEFFKIQHKDAYFVTFFVGKSFSYGKFPGKIALLKLSGGKGAYKEINSVDWIIIKHKTIYTYQQYEIIEDIDFTNKDNQAGIVKKFTNQFNGIQEFGIEGWFRLRMGVKRDQWATGYHLNSNQNPQDLAEFGDRTLCMQVIQNTYHFPTYDLKTKNKNLYKNVEFQQDDEGVWAFIYHGYSPELKKAYVFTQFQNKKAAILEFYHILHKDSLQYHLFVGKSFTYRYFPGRISQLKLSAGDGAYREIEKIDWDLLPSIKVVKIVEIIIIEDQDFEDNFEKDPIVVKKYVNQFNGVQEFGIEGWFKLKPGVKRDSWATAYHFNSNENPQDLAEYGDRTLCMFVLQNTYHFPTYDLKTQNKNLYKNVEFQQQDEGVWAFIYHGYSPLLKKAYVFVQFQNKKYQVLELLNVLHEDSYFYNLFVGKSFNYRNYPGRISQLKLAGGDGAYKEIKTTNWDNMPKVIVYQLTQVTIIIDQDFEDENQNQVVQIFKHKFNGIQEFGIEGWFKLKPGVKRDSWATAYHFNSNENPQDLAEYGDRTLCMFVLQNTYHFPTYDLKTQNKNLYKNVEFQQEDEGVWAFIYHGYSPDLKKAYVFTQLQGKQPQVLELFNVYHQSSFFYNLFVGQSFQYRNFPGRIAQLKLSGGTGAYREIEKVNWDYLPKEVEFSYFEEVVVEDFKQDSIVKKYSNFKEVQEFAVFGWFKLNIENKRESWSTGYHLNSNKVTQDFADYGDRTLSMFIIKNNYHFATYDTRTQNTNLHQNISFTTEEQEKWAFIYFGYCPLRQKGYVYLQFQGQKERILEFLNVKHRSSIIYTIFVGQSFQYLYFPGRIVQLRLAAGKGAYREYGFEDNNPAIGNGKKSIKITKFNTDLIQDVVIQGEIDFGKDNQIVKVYDQQFTGIQEFAIEGWFKLNKGVNRSQWATGYHFNGNEKAQDLADFGDRTLCMFIIQNNFHFPTYDLNTGNKNLYKNVLFNNDMEDFWVYIYHGYSPDLQKAYVFTQFYQQKPIILNFQDVKHKDCNIYRLFVGQSFGYRNFPGKISGLKLSGGLGAYKEIQVVQGWDAYSKDNTNTNANTNTTQKQDKYFKSITIDFEKRNINQVKLIQNNQIQQEETQNNEVNQNNIKNTDNRQENNNIELNNISFSQTQLNEQKEENQNNDEGIFLAQKLINKKKQQQKKSMKFQTQSKKSNKKY
ncbi:hypothetical protein IMG5_110780, partial [Ichthyophthirius multifiliis]